MVWLCFRVCLLEDLYVFFSVAFAAPRFLGSVLWPWAVFALPVLSWHRGGVSAAPGDSDARMEEHTQ